jgi:hypothetical protein
VIRNSRRSSPDLLDAYFPTLVFLSQIASVLILYSIVLSVLFGYFSSLLPAHKIIPHNIHVSTTLHLAYVIHVWSFSVQTEIDCLDQGEETNTHIISNSNYIDHACNINLAFVLLQYP